jgi:hypothetical protein
VFGGLLPDLLGLSCGWLQTRELVTMRRVSKHWAAASRTPAAWVSSHWQCQSGFPEERNIGYCSEDDYEKFNPWQRLADEIIPAAPHLRSLLLPFHADWDHFYDVNDAAVPSLRLLESLTWRHEPMSGALTAAMPWLRHVGRREVDTDGNGSYEVTAEELAAACALPNLVSFRGDGLNNAPHPLRVFSLAPSASTSLRILRLPNTELGDLTAAELSRFLVLEELSLEADHYSHSHKDTVAFLRATTAAPALRLLSVGGISSAGAMELPRFTDAHAEALLSAPAFLARLEWLELGESAFSATAWRRLLCACSALLVLRTNDGEAPPLTQEQWLAEEAAEQAAPAPAGVPVAAPAAAAAAAHAAAPAEGPDAPVGDSALLGALLSAPAALRRRLLHVSSHQWSHERGHARPSLAALQLERRLPCVLVDTRARRGVPGAEELAQLEWLPPELADARTAAALPFGWRDLWDAPLQQLRALKLRLGLPLLPVEQLPELRPALFPEPCPSVDTGC